MDIQTEAEKILKEELAKIQNLNVTNGAILVTRPSTGEILAMVGSVDYYAEPSGAFNVATALRQPGSSIKPIMYSLALSRGFTAASILDDSPVIYNDQWGNTYQPVNYDGKFHGRVPLRYALANSFNITAVRTLSAVGVDNFVDQARKMGITTWNNPARFGLSLTLGGGEVHMTDMAEAFGVFANQGNRVALSDVIRISDTTDKKIYELEPKSTQIMDSGVAYIMSDILSDNFARQWEFGPHSALEIPGYKVSVKTGTTDDKRDNWTIGYTPQYLVAVWVGNNDNSPMNPALASGITGAAPVWNRVMKYVLTKYGYTGWYSKPDDIVEKTCYYGKAEYFIKGTDTNAGCSGSYYGPTPVPSISR
jgi:membrane peptidoglycan carboxypeptidase